LDWIVGLAVFYVATGLLVLSVSKTSRADIPPATVIVDCPNCGTAIGQDAIKCGKCAALIDRWYR